MYCLVRTDVPSLPPLSYAIPEGAEARAGSPVLVEVGRRLVPGVVLSLSETPPEGVRRVKPVSRLVDAPPWGEGFLRFLERMADYAFADPGRTLGMCFPPAKLLTPKTSRVAYASLLPEGRAALEGKLPPKRRAALSLPAERGKISVAALKEETQASGAVLRALKERGWIEITEEEEETSSGKAAPEPLRISLPPLNDGQRLAVESLSRLACPDAGFAAEVVQGVTGSGKTEVFFRLMADVLRQDPEAQVLLLTPEVSLTGQMASRVAERFGTAPALWHHSVSPAARRRRWHEVASGAARIVLGARSALMLPYKRLRLIVLDEEHESSYKQEEGVCYHARDMAVLRASCEGFPILLVSATPSLETLHNVRSGKYGFVRLEARYGEARMPDVRIVDLKKHPPERGTWLSPPVVSAVRAALEQGKQGLLFLNRRGYAPMALCRACGYVHGCANCSAKLVYHKGKGRLACHYCGHAQEAMQKCPSCGAEEPPAFCGPGVERLKEEALARFPGARIACVSGDAPEEIASLPEEMAAGRVDLLIGTQMVAKGLHFPELVMACVVDADMGLYGADPRAQERTFQLIRQVSGRTGRGGSPGTVYLQTSAAEHPLYDMLKRDDEEGFVAAELERRQEAGMPPFVRLALLLFAADSEREALGAARRFSLLLPAEGVAVLGPAPAPMAKVRGKFLFRIVLKSARPAALRGAIRSALRRAEIPRCVSLKIDIDPVTL
jgi:primosomal protein N' (replication factor Y)